MTELQNSGIQNGDRSRRVVASWGALPHLVQAGAVDVELSLQHADRAVIYRLSMSGRRLRMWPVKSRTEGKLTFEADVNDAGRAGMLYEIVVDAE